MGMKAKTKLGVAQATKFVDGHVKRIYGYNKISVYALKIFERFYDPKRNGFSEKNLAMAIVLHDILNQKVGIEEIERVFNSDVALVVFNTNDEDEDYKLKGYERVFKAYDFIFVKLIVRIARIYMSISDTERNKFRDYIDEYNELRRKLLKEVSDNNIMVLMDYESHLIKYGRNVFTGKPINNFKCGKLIIDA